MKIFTLKYIPLTIVIGFNALTLVVFFTAPFKWVTHNLLLFLGFSLFCQAMIVLGYRRGYKRSVKTSLKDVVLRSMSSKNLNFIFIFYSATFLIKYAYRLRLSVLDVKGMVNLLLIGIANPQLGYHLSLDDSRPTTVSWTVYFMIAIVDLVFFIIGFLKWKDMNFAKKSLFVLYVGFEVFYWMGRGTNFGVISLLTTLALTFVYNFRATRLTGRRILKFLVFSFLLLSTSFFVFSYNMSNRAGNREIDIHYFDFGMSQVDKNDELLNSIPKSLRQSYLYIVSYLGQGYYHTSLAFDLDFRSTYLLGSNTVSVEWAKMANIDIWKNTYMYRLKAKGIDPLMKWHSAYMWYASAVTFWGVPFVMYILGYLFGFSWAHSSIKNDFLSRVVFIIVGNMLLYIFANNTYLSSVFYSFVFILPVWYFTRVKKFMIK